jgi:hypothetical protein
VQQPKIVVVDDAPQDIRLLEAVLAPRDYAVLPPRVAATRAS